MSSHFAFTTDEVRKHLADLGYKQITDDQLKDFVKDLRRLIKYEDKQRRLRQAAAGRDQPRGEGHRRSSRLIDDDSSSSSAYGSSYSLDDEEAEGHKEQLSPRRRQRRRSGRRGALLSPAKRRAQSTAAVQRKVTTYVGPGPSVSNGEEEPSTSVSTEAELVIRVLRDSSEPPSPRKASKFRPAHIPPRPTTSFIRPRPLSSGGRRGRQPPSLRTDPVRLHQFYQSLWAKTPFPGDGGCKATRWAVREWMLGPEPKEPKK